MQVDDEPSGRVAARRSLRTKGLLATLVLSVYLLAGGLYVSQERVRLNDIVDTLQELARHEKALALAEAAVGAALVDVNEISSAAQSQPGPPTEITLYMETCTRLFAALDEFDAGYAVLQRGIARSYAVLVEHPVRANWIALRESMNRAADGLEIRRRRLGDQRDALNADYRRDYDRITVESFAIGTFGFVVFGAAAAWFFTRLTGDIRQLETHARGIVRGHRRQTLQVRRHDELGTLMQAVNHMAGELDAREKQIEVEGQRRSHQDKMLALGALAAGVAHEVNNPLAVITGIAQQLQEADARLTEPVEQIIAQARRASQAARDLADLAAPQPADFDWVDLNGIVRRVVQLTGYDKRYRHLPVELVLDPSLPALRSVGAAVEQVLMQVVALGCEACAGMPRGGAPVRVVTMQGAGVARVELDFPAQPDFARADVQRTLLLSRATIEPVGGRLAFGQADSPSLHVTLELPATGAIEE